MGTEEFSVDDWIESVALGLRKLAEAQEPYLQEYYRQNPRTYVMFKGSGRTQPAGALDDLRDLYAMACHSHVLSEWKYFASLCAVLDPARNILPSHSTLARVVSPIIGRNAFYLEILSTGHSTSSGNLVAGLMARAAELTGEQYASVAHSYCMLFPNEVGLKGIQIGSGSIPSLGSWFSSEANHKEIADFVEHVIFNGCIQLYRHGDRKPDVLIRIEAVS